MTDLRKAAEMALNALEDSMYPQKKQFDAIVGLKQALAQPEQKKEPTPSNVDPRVLLGRSNNFTKEMENRMSIEAMKQAVEAFEHIKKYVTDDGAMPENWDAYHEKEYFALEALRQAIEQAEKQEKMCIDCGKPTMHMGNKCYGCCQTTQPEQEPVAWQNKELPMEFYEYEHLDPMWHHHYRPLYTTPPSKPWVSLTDEESSDIYNAHHNTHGECITSAHDLVLDIEAQLKERNT